MSTGEGLSPPPRSALPSHRDAAQAIFTARPQRASQAGVSRREPPPEPTTCCGRRRNGWVWGGHDEAVDYWRQEAAWRLDP